MDDWRTKARVWDVLTQTWHDYDSYFNEKARNENKMALQPIKRIQSTQPAQAAPAAAAPARPTPRPTPSRPAARPAAPAQPQRRGGFLRGVEPGFDRHPPHWESHGRYMVTLQEAQLFESRAKHNICLVAFKVVEVLTEGSVKRVGDVFNLFFSSKNADVYPGAVASMVIGICKPTDEELAADADLPEADQHLMADLFESILDGAMNGYTYDLTLTPAVSSKGAAYTQITYGDATPPF